MRTTNHADNLAAMSCAKHYRQAICRLLIEKLALHKGGPTIRFGATQAQSINSDAGSNDSGAFRGAIIDFGAGQGDYALALDGVTQANVLCVEPARHLHAHYPARLSRCVDLQQIPRGCAAGAYSLNVFEHIPDAAAVLRELAARVAPGQLVLIFVPANPGLWTPMDSAVGHLRRYTPQQLRELANHAGLLVRGEGWFDRTGYFATRLLQLLMQLRLHDREWHGRVSPRQIKLFDFIFRTLEPLLERLNLPFGKNRWVLLEVPNAKKPRNAT